MRSSHAKLVCLTDKGRRVIEELFKRQATWANLIASSARPADIQTALSLLKKLRSRLEADG